MEERVSRGSGSCRWRSRRARRNQDHQNRECLMASEDKHSRLLMFLVPRGIPVLFPRGLAEQLPVPATSLLP